jgi:hypothetical protein
MHHSGVDHDRVREISAEICGLLAEQTRLLNSVTTLTDMSGEDVDGYTQRNDRLRQLSDELNELA